MSFLFLLLIIILLSSPRLSSSTPSTKHFLDILWDIDPACIDVDNLKAVIRDKAWEELPEVLTSKLRPSFAYISQFFLLPQADGKLCLLKHYFVKDEKVKGAYVARLIRGQGHEIAWGCCPYLSVIKHAAIINHAAVINHAAIINRSAIIN